MVNFANKSLLLRFVTALAIILLFGVLLLPTVAETMQTDCDDDCDDHCESVCGCIGCPPVILSYEISPPEHVPAMNIQGYSIISSSVGIEYECLDRVDRPPQTLI